MGIFEENLREIYPSNLQELEAIVKEGWSKIIISVCNELVRNNRKRIKAIIRNNGYTIDY